MKAISLQIPDVLLFVPTVFNDERGFFFESFNKRVFRNATGSDLDFVQDNHSRSSQGVLRGLHFQLDPKAQGKLVRATVGSIFDVAVDIRPESETFGKWVGATLSAENHHQLWIPAGFAHGFLTLSESAEVLYKTTDFWAADHERCIVWNDSDIQVNWPIDGQPILSAKDQKGVPLASLFSRGLAIRKTAA